MRRLALISVLVVPLVLSACGGEASPSSDSASADVARKADEARLIAKETAQRPRPHVELPPGPPPSKLIVKDLEVGTGAVVKPDIGISTHFVSVSYRTGKPYEVRWSQRSPFTIAFGPGLEIKGWEKGLVGMRAGGRRELIVPSKLAYGEGALLYVIDLLEVK